MTSDTHQIPNYMAIFWWLLGLTIGEICDRYYLSENTIKNHLHAAFHGLGLGTLRHQARLGRACYLLGRYDASRDSKPVSR